MIQPLSESQCLTSWNIWISQTKTTEAPPMFVWGGSYMLPPWFHAQTDDGGSSLVTHMARKIGVTDSMLRSLFDISHKKDTKRALWRDISGILALASFTFKSWAAIYESRSQDVALNIFTIVVFSKESMIIRWIFLHVQWFYCKDRYAFQKLRMDLPARLFNLLWGSRGYSPQKKS